MSFKKQSCLLQFPCNTNFLFLNIFKYFLEKIAIQLSSDSRPIEIKDSFVMLGRLKAFLAVSVKQSLHYNCPWWYATSDSSLGNNTVGPACNQHIFFKM